jgi:hypothetical protein
MSLDVAAQYLGVPNDQLFVYAPGAFKKTLKEQLGGGKTLPLNDEHFFGGRTVRSILGSVLAGDERDDALWLSIKIASTEKDVQAKIREGHINEVSIEVIPIAEHSGTVHVSKVPGGDIENVADYYHPDDDGMVGVRIIDEAMLRGLALVIRSSQDRQAVFASSGLTVVNRPIDGTRVVSTPWSADDAKKRVRNWAGIISQPGKKDAPNYAKLHSAQAFVSSGIDPNFEDLDSLIVDIIDGNPCVVVDSFSHVAEHAAKLKLPADKCIELGVLFGSYMARLENHNSSDSEGPSDNSPSDDGPATPPSDGQGAEHALQLLGIRLRMLEP